MNVIESQRPFGEPKRWSYEVEGEPIRYYFNLGDLKKDYNKYVRMSNEDFIKNLIEATHFACIIAYYKNLTPEQTLLDGGIVHELIHYQHFEKGGLGFFKSAEEELKDIRKKFKELLKV